jgi:retinoid hydroxylase
MISSPPGACRQKTDHLFFAVYRTTFDKKSLFWLKGYTSMQQTRSFEEIPFVELPSDYQTNVGPFLARTYDRSGPIFRSTFFGTPVVYMIGPEANRFVLASHRQAFAHRQGWWQVVEMFGDGLLTMDGSEHDDHRRMMNPAFTISYMDHYLPIMNRSIRARSADWAARGTVDVYEEARKITFDVAAEALTGLQAGPEVDNFRDTFVQILNLGMVALDDDDYTRRLGQLKEHLYTLLLPKIQERRHHPTNDVLGMLVQARDDTGRALSDEQLFAHTNILLVAGHETSTSLVSWLLYLLTQNPDYLQRVLAEQTALLDDTAEPTLEAIKHMKVLENALSEAERLYPPVGNGPRGTFEEVVFHGYRIPADTRVFYSIAASHLIASIFANPTTFDPDRFAPPREEHKKVPYALVGFGGGPRICIGTNFAKVEIKAMVSHLLRRYQFELVPNQRIEQLYRGTGMPIQGIKMFVSEKQRVRA